jgi:hypothetical protein
VSERGARWREWPATAAIFVVALLPRLYVAIAWAREPVWDGHYYDFGARRIADGFGYSDDVMVDGVLRWHPWCHYPVGYSGLLAVAYVVFGKGPHVATVLNAVLGSILAGLVHRASLLALSPWRARLAGLLVALSPELVLYAALLMTEPAASLAPVAAALLFGRDRERNPLRGAALAGVVLGLGTLVRPQTVLCAPGLFLMAWGSTWGSADLNERLAVMVGRAAAVAAVATAACLATVLPWTARNCRVMDGCAFVSTNAGWNLAIGAFPRATGRFETLRATDGCPVVTGQVQQDRCWAKVGAGYIAAEPRRWVSLVPRKLSNTFDHASFPMGYLGEADRERFPEATKARGRVALTLAHRLLLSAASLCVVGLGALRRPAAGAARWVQGGVLAALSALLLFLWTAAEPSPFWWLAALTPLLAALPLPGAPRLGPLLRYLLFTHAAVVVTHAVFFGEDRYHVFVTPILAVLAASILRPEAPLRSVGGGPGGDPATAEGAPPASQAEPVAETASRQYSAID